MGEPEGESLGYWDMEGAEEGMAEGEREVDGVID